MLLEGQVKIRDTVMGPGTQFRVMSEFNPFQLQARASSSSERAWGHGSWSGAEWADARVVPMTVLVRDQANLSTAGWLAALQELAAAFSPIGDTIAEVELRFKLGGREYMLFGRPRMVEAGTHMIGVGHEFVRCAFVALDPRIYAASETVTDPIGMPTFSGGLTVPLTVPFTVAGTQTGGLVSLVNEGTTDTALLLRIDGPVTEPRVTLVQSDGTVETLRVETTLTAGQWLDIDTAARTVLLNGTISRRGRTTGDFMVLPKGTHTLKFNAAVGDGAQLTARFRSAWW